VVSQPVPVLFKLVLGATHPSASHGAISKDAILQLRELFVFVIQNLLRNTVNSGGRVVMLHKDLNVYLGSRQALHLSLQWYLCEPSLRGTNILQGERIEAASASLSCLAQ